MLPAFLITFREVIEAALIVATISGILTKLNQKKGIQTTIYATIIAIIASMALIIMGSFLGFSIQALYTGKTQALFEGTTMIVSAIFITWAVFFFHKYFAHYKIRLLKKVKETVERQEQEGLFILVFTAVFREGLEIALFLSTVYLSSNPKSIFIGFSSGTLIALLIAFALFTSLLRLPLYQAFRVTSVLLVLFAAGLLGRGAHEFVEIGMLPSFGNISFAFLPHDSTFMGILFQSVFGLTKNMNVIQLSFYSSYALIMSWWLFLRKGNKNRST